MTNLDHATALGLLFTTDGTYAPFHIHKVSRKNDGDLYDDIASPREFLVLPGTCRHYGDPASQPNHGSWCYEGEDLFEHGDDFQFGHRTAEDAATWLVETLRKHQDEYTRVHEDPTENYLLAEGLLGFDEDGDAELTLRSMTAAEWLAERSEYRKVSKATTTKMTKLGAEPGLVLTQKPWHGMPSSRPYGHVLDSGEWFPAGERAELLASALRALHIWRVENFRPLPAGLVLS